MFSMQKLDKILTKKPVIAGELLFLAVVGYMLLGNGSTKHKAAPAQKQVAAAEKMETNQAVHDQPASLDFSKNPFIDASDVMVDINGDMSNPRLASVPQIPHGRIPVPSLPGGMPFPGEAGSIPVQAAAPKVSGILTSTNGNNIAIMSDGRVVSEGDTFNDKRISFIGGEGITFDNGDFWAYGDSSR